MINYSEELKKLRFSFRPEELIDYQTLISLLVSLMAEDNKNVYEENKEEMFHTIQIISLVYGLEEHIQDNNYVFDVNNDIDDINYWASLIIKVFADLDIKGSDAFEISDSTLDLMVKALKRLNNQLDGIDNNLPNTEPDYYCTQDEDCGCDSCNCDTATFIQPLETLHPTKCCNCGLEEWQGKPLKMYVALIDKNKPVSADNIQFLCPNCYSQIC